MKAMRTKPPPAEARRLTASPLWRRHAEAAHLFLTPGPLPVSDTLVPSTAATRETRPMEDAAYWRQQAINFRDRAQRTTDRALVEELRELAEVCEEVAAAMEERAASG